MHIYGCLLALKPLGRGPIRKRLEKCSISRLTSQVVGLARGHLSPVAPVQLQAYLANGNSRANGQHPYNTTHRISNVYSMRISNYQRQTSGICTICITNICYILTTATVKHYLTNLTRCSLVVEIRHRYGPPKYKITYSFIILPALGMQTEGKQAS